MIEENKYHVYTNKDGRMRVYDKETKKVTSYPRLLMEEELGRPLEDYEDVHHINGDKTDNRLENLEIVDRIEHRRMHGFAKSNWEKAEDLSLICPICGNEFIFTVKQQKCYAKNKYRRKSDKHFCSPKCVGIHNQREQMRQKMQSESQ